MVRNLSRRRKNRREKRTRTVSRKKKPHGDVFKLNCTEQIDVKDKTVKEKDFFSRQKHAIMSSLFLKDTRFISRKNKKLTDKYKKNKKSYNIFCYLNKKKQIGLTKNNDLGFLKEYCLPKVKEKSKEKKFKNWNFLCNYKNFISNKKLDINLYYKFSSKIPKDLNWHSIYSNKEFIPTFTKKIFKQVENLYCSP